ncbi:MAG: hypothetical protein U1F43_02770 [Myxococcota bacterium]
MARALSPLLLSLLVCCSDAVTGAVDVPATADADAAPDTAAEVTPDTVVADTAAEVDDDTTAEVVADTDDTVAETVDDTVGEVVADTTAEVIDDVDAVDPCEPNPCLTPPDSDCDHDELLTFAAVGACSAGDGEPVCDYAEARTACGDAARCYLGRCLADGDPCDYAFDERVSYVTRLQVGSQGRDDEATGQPVDVCCFDLTGDGKIDNRIGDIFDAARSFSGDVNEIIQEQIDYGAVVLLFQTRGVESAVDDDAVEVDGFYGSNPDGDHAADVAGLGTLSADPTSFVPGTAEPEAHFGTASITAGVLDAGPARFHLRIPLFGAALDIAVSQTRLVAEVAVGPNGHGLTLDGTRTDPDSGATYGAMLGGAIRQLDLLAALNDFIRSCGDCVTFPDDAAGLFTVDADGAVGCQTPIANSCGDPACSQIPDLCPLILGLAVPDVDLDHDGVPGSPKDGLSVGAFIKATSAHVGAVDGCPTSGR